ncbi:MAG: hypothetical protein LBO67_04330 [Spirochaetaceae bacterium]|jgi:hypothetical protein|nr:hypothetical protein [Spirochaetaceae bacterium]
MAEISQEQKMFYASRISFYQQTINTLLQKEQDFLLEIEKETEQAPLKKFALVDVALNITSNYIIQSGISEALMRVKNESALNEGRKAIYRSIIYLEDIVTNWIDVPFADYKEKVLALEPISCAERFDKIRKLGFTIQLIEDTYGDNSKWKWSFVDLEGRFAVVSKNILNMESMIANMDTRSPNYEPTVLHIRLIKRQLGNAANRFREKYELSSQRIDDFRTAINLLNALRRVHIFLNESGEAEMLKKKSEAWLIKLESDIKSQNTAKQK